MPTTAKLTRLTLNIARRMKFEAEDVFLVSFGRFAQYVQYVCKATNVRHTEHL